ncbi:MAG: hypothetical protein ACYTFK_14055 [Planctomycetota bacterium]|jgi:hypothetical protein
MREYDFAGAARFLKISSSAVTQHVSKGHIKTVYRAHIGSAGKRMIREVDLLTFIWSDKYTGRKRDYDKPGKSKEVKDDLG